MTLTIDKPAVSAAETTRERAEKDLERVRSFIARDTGKASSLRRAAGETLADARNIRWFFALTGEQPFEKDNERTRYEEILFLVATLFASDKAAVEKRSSFRGDLGATLAWVRGKGGRVTGENEDPVERRLRILLDCDLDVYSGGELAYRLRQIVRYVLSQGGAIDWPQLLSDVRQWDRVDKRVQKRWARSFYKPRLNDNFESADGSQA